MSDYNNLTGHKRQFVDLAFSVLNKQVITRSEIIDLVNNHGAINPVWFYHDPSARVKRGTYRLPLSDEQLKKIGQEPFKATATVTEVVARPQIVLPVLQPTVIDVPAITDQIEVKARPKITSISADFAHNALIPQTDSLYVPFGDFSTVRKIVESKIFFPVFITGLSGNGKTMMVEQACAQTRREMIPIDITAETDEDSLVGSFVLVNGETVWQDGPIVVAMKRGAVACMNEFDTATEKVMCLQRILEGRSIYQKRINQWVHPQPGFNVIVTANTKGKGDDGKFIGTRVMNEALLERFCITIEQEYPSTATEKKILTLIMKARGITDTVFADKLVDWADGVRKTYMDNGIDELIATRRLVHILNAYAIFSSSEKVDTPAQRATVRMKAIKYCTNRFDPETKKGMLELYTKVDETIDEANEVKPVAQAAAAPSGTGLDLTPF